MPDLDALFPGRFLKGRTLAAPTLIRIMSVEAVTFDGDEDADAPGAKVRKVEAKGVLRYKSAAGDGEMILNKTNALLIAAMFGRDFSTWGGKYVVIFFDPEVRFGADKPGGIRVYGSPEITRDIPVEIKRPRRRKPDRFTLHKTDKQGRNAAPQTTDAPARTPGEEG